MEHGEFADFFTKPAANNINSFDEISADNLSEEKTSHGTAEPDTEATHPVTQFADFALNFAIPLCQHNGITPPQKDTYDAFTRQALNEAAWAYLPNVNSDGETPKWILLIVAVAGMGLVFMPTVLDLIAKRAERTENETEEPEETETIQLPEAEPEPPEPTLDNIPDAPGAIPGL